MDHKTNIAFQSAAEIKKLQETKLQELLVYLQNNSPYYKQLFTANNIDISTIKALKDLSTLPTTGKEELQKMNNDFLYVPKNKVIEYTATSGTIGKPVTVALSDNDQIQRHHTFSSCLV